MRNCDTVTNHIGHVKTMKNVSIKNSSANGLCQSVIKGKKLSFNRETRLHQRHSFPIDNMWIFPKSRMKNYGIEMLEFS